MKLRDIAPLVLMVVLGGCNGADWDHAFNYIGIEGTDEQASPPSQQPAASAVETAPLSTPEDVAATTRPWTPVGALPSSSQAAMAEPLSPTPAAAAELVPPPRPRVVASVPPVFTPPVAAAPVPRRSEPPPVVAPAPIRPAPRAVAAAPAPARSMPPVAAAPEPMRSEPSPAAAPAPIRPAPQTVAAIREPARTEPRTVAAAPSIAEPPSDAPAADPWCSRIAQSARADAASQGFDAATQRHRAEVTYNQCVRFGH